MKTRIALITGVGRGLGFELTREYCRLGWRVFGVFRNEADGPRLASTFGEAFVPILADLHDDSAVKKIRSSLEKQTDYLSLLINNAGIAGTGHSIEEASCSEIKELFEVHCCGAIRCLQAALPFLTKAELPTVVNVSSRVGSIYKVSSGDFDHLPLSYSIRIAKAAQNMLSATIYRELRESGIAVFAIHPGRIQTRMGSPDADLTAEQAAKIFVGWLPKIRQERDFGYFEAGAEELPF
ncbi:MAG: SDR family NAD(P)-dependent oxidoreductase [Desulfobacterales bacterium]|nr:SDR family NAD(P)-dependent oxidoreductase [Desulfobacterales bacterium]